MEKYCISRDILVAFIGAICYNINKKKNAFVPFYCEEDCFMAKISPWGKEILAEDISYRKLKSIAKDKIREKVSGSVKNNCA